MRIRFTSYYVWRILSFKNLVILSARSTFGEVCNPLSWKEKTKIKLYKTLALDLSGRRTSNDNIHIDVRYKIPYI